MRVCTHISGRLGSFIVGCEALRSQTQSLSTWPAAAGRGRAARTVDVSVLSVSTAEGPKEPLEDF